MSIIVLTNDGFSAKIFYNPKCARNSHELTKCNYKECDHSNIDAACMNVIYDMNGTKKPNQVGEDIGFVTVFWSGVKTTSTAPGIPPYSVNRTGIEYSPQPAAQTVCVNKGTSKIPYTLPSVDEMSSLYMNNLLTSLNTNQNYWSGTPVVDRNYMWAVTRNSGYRYHNFMSDGARVYCVYR